MTNAPAAMTLPGMTGAPMPEIPASHRDLLDGQFATLATIGPDGRPQLSEVWLLAEGDEVSLSLNTARQKTQNMVANPAATVFLLDPASSYRYLEIRGDAEITPDDDYAFADAVGARYGSDLREHDQPGQSRVKVTIRPVRVNAVSMGGCPARRSSPAPAGEPAAGVRACCRKCCCPARRTTGQAGRAWV